jgi:hypothetical protein
MSKQQGRVVQMSEDEAARLRGARKVVDAEVVDGSERHGSVNIPACSVCVGVGQVIGPPSRRQMMKQRSRVWGTP